MPIDPDVIEQAPEPGAPPPAAAEVARQEASAARNDANVGRAEFRSRLGQYVTHEEIKTLTAAGIAVAAFLFLILVVWQSPSLRQAAWSLLVAIITGAVALVFGKLGSGGQ